MTQVEPEWILKANCADQIERQMDSLAPYVVDNDEGPVPPKREGMVYGLLVFSDTLADIDTLHDGFVLPMEWKRGESDDKHLPTEIRETADEVREQVDDWLDLDDFQSVDETHMQVDDWGIRLPEELGSLDLSEMSVRGRSLWAPMATGLLLAILGGKPKRHVFSTGAWHGGGIEAVGGIEAKVDAVRRMGETLDRTLEEGLDAPPILFVPDSKEQKAEDEANGDVDVHTYPEAETKLDTLFYEHLRELDSPPRGEKASVDEMAEYINRPYYWRSPYRTDYYLEQLLEPLADSFRDDLPDDFACERLVLTLGFHYELPVMLLHAYRPSAVTIVYSEDSLDRCFDELTDIVEDVGAIDPEIETLLMDGERGDEVVGSLIEWLRDAPEDERVVDVTPGTSRMSAISTLVAEYAPADLFYVEHDYQDGPTFNTEVPKLLDWDHRQ